MARNLSWQLALIAALILSACTPVTPAPTAILTAPAPLRPTATPTRIVLLTPTRIPVATPKPSQAAFLARQGTELVLQGQPFHEISFNKFDLFHQFVLEKREHYGEDGIPDARQALRILAGRGFHVIRVNGSPFYPLWFNQVFFDDDPQRQVQKRQLFFSQFDAMLDACDEYGIRVVLTLIWNIENLADLGHHSLEEGILDPQSEGRRRIEDYVRAVVTRYQNRPTIAIWEIGNEWNLLADLQLPNGPLTGSSTGDQLHPGPLVRDRRNNFTSDDLALFYQEIATLIRSLDNNHLITTGNSAPRPAAMHLLRAARVGAPVDWTFDTRHELTEYLELTHPNPVDVISIHYYDDAMLALGGTLGSPANLRFFKSAADKIGKPLLIGEIGLHSKVTNRYDSEAALRVLNATLPILVELKIPLTLYWAFSDDRTFAKEEMNYSLRYGSTDNALWLIEDANSAFNN